MTGPEHYREAERLLQPTDLNGLRDGTGMVQPSAVDVAAAQVHATLALAAVTAEPIAQSYDGPGHTTIARAWSRAIS